jgi:hypothetical protein
LKRCEIECRSHRSAAGLRQVIALGSSLKSESTWCSIWARRLLKSVRHRTEQIVVAYVRWRTVQASPRVPAALLRPHQPTSAEPVLLLPYSPGASPSRFASGRCFHVMTGRYAISCVSPFPGRPAPRPHRVCFIGSKGSLQTPAPVATEGARL